MLPSVVGAQKRRKAAQKKGLGPFARYKGPMDAALSFGKTTLVLIGLWAALALVGFVSGVIPWPPGSPQHLPVEASTTEDAGVIADAGVEIDAEVAPDAGLEHVETPPPPPEAGPALPRLRVCAEPTLPPSLSLVDVVGDTRPEIVIGCGAGWDVLGRSTDDAWMRVAHVDAPAAPADRMALTSAVAAIDVDGDGDLDPIFPVARVGAGGSTAGGGLFVLTRNAWGAIEQPRSLAPIAAVGVRPVTLTSGPGIVALDRANPFAREPSEAWVFSLGASPSRVSSPHVATDATGFGVVDIDRDGKQDILVASSSESRLDLLYGDASGRFARSRTLSVPSATDIAVGDLDGDGAPDALIVGATVSRLIASTTDAALAPIEGAPTELRDAAILDLDHDGHADIVGWSHPRLVVLAGSAEGTFETRTVFELAGGEVGPRRHVVADLDGDDAPEIILLTVGETEGARTLDLVVVPSSARGLVRTGDSRLLPDAPLMLTISLPDPNAP